MKHLLKGVILTGIISILLCSQVFAREISPYTVHFVRQACMRINVKTADAGIPSAATAITIPQSAIVY